jgi:hypothetical protein
MSGERSTTRNRATGEVKMSKQVEMIRELNDNELDVVSGAKPKEAEAGRYTAVDWGPFKFAYNNKGDWGMTFNGVLGYTTSFVSVGGWGIEVVNR